MRKFLNSFMSFTLLGWVSVSQAEQVDIAVIADGPSDWNRVFIESLESELDSLSDSDFSFHFPAAHQYDSNWSLEKTRSDIDKALADSEIDITLAVGVLSSSQVASYRPDKPLIASTVINPTLQNFPVNTDGSTGIRNLHYLAVNYNFEREVRRFQQVTDAKKIGLVVDQVLYRAIPAFSETVDDIVRELEFEVTVVHPFAEDETTMVESLPADIDAVFVLPQDRLSESSYQEFIDFLNQQQIPSFSSLGREDVNRGFLMGVGMAAPPKLLARQLAVDIRDIALGRSAGDLPVSIEVKDRLTINMQTARLIDYEPPFDLFFEAELINEFDEAGRVLTLISAVDESLKQNLSLATATEELRLSEQDTRIARSSLLPQLDGTASWEAQDRDLANSLATRTTTLGLSASQSLYSESNISNYTSSKYLEKAQVAALRETRLDVIEETAQAYLSVLIAKTERSIQLDNLKLTQANLERAQFRYEVGSTDRSEVLRFETELGTDRQAITSAEAAYRQSLIELNRILHRPLGEVFQTSEPGLNSSQIFSDERLVSFIDNRRDLKIFSDFLTQHALENSPELEALDNQIASQERLLLAAERKRYVPDVNLVGTLDYIVDDYGSEIEIDYDENWTVGVEASWPLYQGSRISAEKNQASIELKRLKLLYQQTADSVESASRNSVLEASASRININHALFSATAAEKTLELVTDSYVRGASNYIDLIDAQSSYLSARLTSANAIYEHLLDLMAVQRAIGFFDFYVTSTQTEDWFDELSEYKQSFGGKQ